MKTASIVAIMVAGLAGELFAASITLQNHEGVYSGCVDTYLKSGASDDENYGGAVTLEVGWRSRDRDTLIAFDLSPIPTGQHITSASLGLYWTGDFGIGLHDWLDVAVFPLKKPWTEGTGDGQGGVDRSGASWLYQYAHPSTTTWANAGANHTTHDRDANSDAELRFVSHTVAQWVYFTSTDVTQTVSDWYTGARSNYGWVADFTGANEDGQSVDFNASELAETSYQFRPKLLIEYEPIPEPSALLLAGLGLLACAAHRSQGRGGDQCF